MLLIFCLQIIEGRQDLERALSLREKDEARIEAQQKAMAKKDFEILCLQRQLGSKPTPEL
eukprot:SAG31_NODE_39605_length_287_cov_0.675532_2_plen_59_part_01